MDTETTNHHSRKPRRPGRTAAASLAGAALLALGAGAGAATYAAATGGDSTPAVRATSPATAAARQSGSLSVNEIYRRDGAGVVEITASGAAQDQSALPFPNGNGTQQAQGSGFVYDDSGHIVTNEHVIDGASSIRVQLSNGKSYQARVVGKDTSTDLAVLDIDAPASELRPIALADSSNVSVGDGVVAIGNPFGLEGSVTSGIVSALHRQIGSPNGFAINDAIQTDAAINHGNSGGVLLDLRGRVIGVTAQIQSDSGGNDGVGFAIPANTVKNIADQLIADGAVSHPYLGVGVDTIPASAADALNTRAGVAVTQVRAGTPAARAGLRAATGSKDVDGTTYPTGGDVIAKLDGAAVTSAERLQELIAEKQPGDRVSLTVVRDGNERTVEVTLGTRPS